MDFSQAYSDRARKSRQRLQQKNPQLRKNSDLSQQPAAKKTGTLTRNACPHRLVTSETNR
jgi:hypothetical protein